MMLKGILLSASVLVFVSGCASTSTGGEGESLLERAGSGVSSAASSVGSAVSGVFAGYENGTKIEGKYLASLTAGKTTSADVEQAVGAPVEKSTLKGGVAWKYPYSKIPHFGANVNETTVFEFDKKGILTKAYKANGRSNATGNALIDAANGQ